jgi:hypothetical protein
MKRIEKIDMNDKKNLIIGASMLQIKESLDVAMDRAGGSEFNVQRLSEMSALELLSLLSTNNIAFIFLGDKPDDKTHSED